MDMVFMFPGVGSHYSGMGKYLYDNFPIAQEVFEEASESLNVDMAALCMGSMYEAQLDLLENSQTALVTTSIAAFRVFEREVGIKANAMIGYSLGEYTALCASGAIALKDVLKLVHERSVILSDHASTIDGTMAWVNNLSPNFVKQICTELSAKGEEVYISAYDTPSKTSISGTTHAVRLACEKAVDFGGIAIPLKMSGPFHSPMMRPAASKYKEVLKDIKINPPQVPVIANHNCAAYQGVESVIKNLYQQLVKPVFWMDTIGYLIREGLTTAIEIGPNEVLKYLLQAIDPSIIICNYEKEKDIVKANKSLFVQESDYEDIVMRCLTIIETTKNYNPNTSLYQEQVVLPFQKIQDQYKEVSESESSMNLRDVEKAILMTETALETKMIKKEKRNQLLQKALNYKKLQSNL